MFDTLLVTDAKGQKIVDPQKQRDLQASRRCIDQALYAFAAAVSRIPRRPCLHFREFVGQLFTRPDWPEELDSLEKTGVLDALGSGSLGSAIFCGMIFCGCSTRQSVSGRPRRRCQLATAKSREMLEAELRTALETAASPEARSRDKWRETLQCLQRSRNVSRRHAAYSGTHPRVQPVSPKEAFRRSGRSGRRGRRSLNVPGRAGGAIRNAACSETSLWPSVLRLCAGKVRRPRTRICTSDIELMFVYAGEGRTTGPQVVSTTEFYVKLVEGVTHVIKAHREGIFEIDLRLRPCTVARGSLAVSLEAFRGYFGPQGAAWPYERQALVKLRCIAGDEEFGRQVVSLRDEFIYTGEPFDVAAMRGMRERQLRQLVDAGTFNAKLSPGGLVDTEYLVQGLQITHGRRLPDVRLTNTVQAIEALLCRRRAHSRRRGQAARRL